jgi:hypothetical protein
VITSVSAALTPGDHERDWKRRWEEAERGLARIKQPRTGDLSAEAVNAAHQELQSFFIQTYHLKDALKADGSVPQNDVEQAITNDADLALLTDLANLDKHFKLNRDARSGDTPVIGPAQGVTTSDWSGWQLSLPITHGGNVRDGLEVAEAAVEAWRRHLKRWRLI